MEAEGQLAQAWVDELTLFSDIFEIMAKMAASASRARLLSLPAMALTPPPALLRSGGAMNSASASAIAPYASKTSCQDQSTTGHEHVIIVMYK